MKRIELKNWQLYTENGNKIDVKVPGDVTYDLFKAGIIPDPLFGDNLKKINSVFYKDWQYECVFLLTESDLNKDVILTFEGIDTLAEIALNGNLLGCTDNMFLKYEYNLKGVAAVGENRLSVKIFSSSAYVEKSDEHLPMRAIFTTGRLYLRKAQCHFGWDWAPNLPGAGIYLPAYLKVSEKGRIELVEIVTDNSGNVEVKASVAGDSSACRIHAKIGDNRLIGEVIDGKAELKTKIDSPKLWWPNGYGEANLYDYEIELFSGENPIDEKKGRFGFKEIKLVQEPIDGGRYSFYFVVNGKKVFAKGSNWVPISNMTGAIEDEKYIKLLRIAKENNMNMLRVWGGGIYEKEIFYDLCDELGIMVWQDFGFACSVIPVEINGIEENFLKEAEYQINRLKIHTSLSVLCGGNENYVNFDKDKHEKGAELVQKTLKNLCERFCNTAYIYNSPSSFLGEDEYGMRSGDGHLSALDATIKKDAFDDFRTVIADRECQFVSESALLGPTRKRSLKRFLPEASLEKIDNIWDFHFVKNPYSCDCSDSFINKEIRYSERFFGKIEGVNDFLKKGMISHLETLGAELDFARANPNCGGYMNWMYNDNWGCGTWAIVDYYFEKKPVIYRVKRAFGNVYASATVKKDGTYAFVANDLGVKIEGVLTIEAKTLGGDVVNRKELTLSVGPREVENVPVEFAFDGDYISVGFTSDDIGSKSLFFRKQWKNLKFVSSLLTKIEKTDDYSVKVTVTAKEFAKNVFIDYPSNDGIVYSDNFFDMEKGEVKEVQITGYKPINGQFITIKTFADEWED